MPQDPIIALLQNQGLDPFTQSKPVSRLQAASISTSAAEISRAAAAPFQAQLTIGKGVNDILAGGAKAEMLSPYENVSSSMLKGIEIPQISLDKGIQQEIKVSADVLSRTLREGSLEESQAALKELRDKYNNISKSVLSNKEKENLRQAYAGLVEQVNQINTFKLAKQQTDSFFSENALEDREKGLKDFNANSRLPLSLKSKQARNSDIINSLADFESNRIGSRLYNEEDLSTFKSTYVDTDKDLYAGMEMQYNYAVKQSVDEKINDYQKQIQDLDSQIKQSYDQGQKNALAMQKAGVVKELNYANNLSQKLKPYTNEDTYLKNFYPEEYTKKKDRQKQEVYRNEMLAEGDQGSWSETLYRSAQSIGSNFTKQISGAAYLFGNKELGYRLKSAAESIAPPTYFVGKDLNKNNKIDDSEITRDIHGNRVTMSQVRWIDKSGESHWNLWAPVEQTLPILTDVLTTVAISKGLGAVGRGVGLTYGRMGAAAGLGEAANASFVKNWAPRISTMGITSATTFPRFYAEERSNFKNSDDAFKVATMRAAVEGLTESIVPDVNMFSGKIAYGALDPAFAKLGKLDPASLSRLTVKRDVLLGLLPKGAISPAKAALLMAPAALRRTLSGASQESIEELGSLVGNYVVDQYASNQNFEVEETNQLTGEAFLDTLVEGFIPSLFISGGSTLLAKGAMKKERLDQARWNIANNPEKYKQLIANQVQNQKITKDEGLKRTVAIDRLAKQLEVIPDIQNIKSLTTLLDDKEAQYNFFNNVLFQEDLLTVDTTQLSEEQVEQHKESLAKVSKEILTTKKLADKYAGLEENDKKAIISKLFDKQAQAATSEDATLSSIMFTAEQTKQMMVTAPVNDPRYEFINEQYKNFQSKVDANIRTRVENFASRLESTPEQVTLLELQMAQDNFLPALERLDALDKGMQVENSPMAPEMGPMPDNTPELMQAIKDELASRKIISAEDFNREVSQNLKNPETKQVQESQLGVAELSEEELATGELSETAHEHLSDTQRFSLATSLQNHKKQKDQSPSELTDLEEFRNRTLFNIYKSSLEGLTPENQVAKIIEMNKVALGIAVDTPAVNNFSANPTNTAVPVTPAPVVNIPGQLDEVDKEVYNQYANFLNQLNQQLADFDLSTEEARIMLAEFNKSLFDELLKLDSLNKVRSALLAIFPENVEAIESMYEAAKDGNINLDQLGFSPKRKERLIARLTTLISQADSTPETPVVETPTNEVLEEAPEIVEDGENTQVDNYNLGQDLTKKEVINSIKGSKGLELQLISVTKEDVSLNDPAVTLAYNILDAYSLDVRLGKTRNMKVRIQSMMGIYEFVLPAGSVERLNELKQLKSLSPEERVELRGLLSVNNSPIHNEGMLSFLEENPSEIGTGVGTAFVNSDNNLLKFTAKGKPSTAKTAFVFIPAIKKTGIQSEKEIRERVGRGEILVSPISGIVSGVDKTSPLTNAVGENIYVHTGPTQSIKGDKDSPFEYILKPGVVYLQKEDARYQYTGINIPTNGSDIQILVNAFNKGTLPETIDESIRQDASLFLNYLNRQINSTKVGKEETLKIRFFKKATLFLSTTNDNKLIVKYQVEGKDGKKYLKPSKNQDEDLLKIGQSSYKLVDARFLEDNKPYTALVVDAKGKISTKQFNSYSDFIKSPEFGANYVREENRTFSFSPELESLNTSSVAVDEIDTTPIAPISEVPTTPTQPTQPTEGPKRLSRRAQLNAQRAGEAPTNDDDVMFRAKALSNSITGRQNTLAKAWVANHPIFKNTPFIFDETISHPEAYAVWSKAGIFLYEGANYAEAYHESWHEFSQLYLTPEQKAALYAEARELYGDLTFVQLEERLADDFRAYALSEGKEFPALIQQARKSKSIFKEIWDFISNLFLNKKTVDHYFSRLYKGNLNGFKRRESNQYFKQLYSGKYTYNDAEGVSHALSYVDSKKYLDDLDSLYVATTSAMSKDKGVTFVNILANPKQANLVYSMMAKRLDSEYTELLESYEQTGNAEYVPRIDAIVDLLENFEATVKFHKQNSFLFEDKVRKALLNNQIVEQESVNAEFAAYEASVNEMSQKQLASQTLISALRTLPRYENGVQVFHPVFGTPLLSDFSSNWNILQRRLSGVNSYSELFSRVENIAEVYPQFTEFLSYLPTPEEDLTFTSDLNFKNEFYRIFSMPYIEGYTTDIKRDEDGNIEDVRVFQAQSLDAQNIRRSFDSAFSLNPSEYSLTNAETGTAYLNTTKYFNTFPGIPAVPIDEEEFEDYNRSLYNMLTPLGFNLSPNSIELFVKEDPTVQSARVSLIYNKLKSLSQVQAYIATPLASISSSHMIEDKGSKIKVEGENTSISNIIQYEVEANPQYVNDMRYNAVQKQIWSVNQHTLMTRVLGVLNDEISYPTLEDVYRELPHLDPTNNPNTIGSFVLSYLFNTAGNRITDKMQNQQVYRKVELGNLLGIKDKGEGEKTIDSNEAKKHYADILGLVKSGVEEINRLSGKSTTRGLIMDLRLRKFLGFNNSTNQVDEFIAYGPAQVPYSLFVSRILPLIKSEVEVTLKDSDKYKISPLDGDGSPKLTYFHKIFTPEQRTALYAAYTSADSTKSLKDVFEEMPEEKAIFNKFQEYIASNVKGSEAILGTTYPVDKVDLFKYHFFSFVSRIEQHKIFFNHPYYYKNPKDIEKRLSMWNAFGSYAIIDQQNIDYLLSDRSGLSMYSHRDAFHAHAGQVGIKINANRAAVDQISYLVLKDEPIKSPTAKASKFYGKYKDAYTNDPKSEKQNAAAFCTLDFYRKFYSLSTGITLPMKQEFDRQDKIYKKYLELQRADEFTRDQINKELEEELNKGPFYKFTIKKLQYAGHNKIESGESVPVGHKYSMKPILPSEIIGDPKLASILQKLHASSAEYAVFESGTKLSETVKPVSLFNAKGEVQDKAVPVGLIDLKNLKEQVLIENKEDFNNIFSTQFRKLVYKDITTPEGEALYESYKSIIENLTNFDKLNFLEQLDDKEKLVEFLIREISKKNAAESTKDLLRLKEDGTLTHSLDSMVDRTVMESAVVSSVKNQIIKQKLPGAQRVQYPVSLIRPSRKLRFYDIVDGKITKAEAMVSFSKGYYPLLNLLSPVDKQPIGQLDNEGNVINPHTALTRLNEALANPKFRSRYANQLTMEAIRIPGEKHRSMENYEIVEFLPEESGEIILVPDEIVIKSGGDFDIDKLFCYDAVLNADGSFTYGPEITSQEAFELKKDLINRLQENKELFREFYQDKQDLIQDLQDILVSRGIAADTKVSALYKELRSYKYVNEQELVEEGAITETDQERLRKWAAGEVSTEKKDLSKDIKNRIKVLRATLSEISDEGLSQEITNINTRLSVIAKEGRDIKDELKNLRGRFTNRLLLNISNRLSQPEIFEDLIAPNDIAKVTEAVKLFGTSSDITTASLTNLVSPLYQLYVFSLNTYKTSLGTDAKNNVFHALLQRTTFYREDKNGNRKFLLDANRTVDGFLNFSGVFDVDGSKISNISGEMISAHVDIEKNDGIAQIGLNNVITPVVNYANMAGARFFDMVKLINLTNGVRKQSSIIRYSRGRSIEEILEDIYETAPEGSVVKSLIDSSKDQFGRIFRDKFINNVFNQMLKNTTSETSKELMLSVQDSLQDLRRFAQFLELEDQTRDLATISLATDYDTFSPQNFESFRSNILSLIPYIKEGGEKAGIFNKKGLDDIINNSIIAPFRVQQDVLDKFVEVFPISANPKITNTILKQFAIVQKINRKLDYDKFSRTFKNDLLYALYINNVPQVVQFEAYLDKTSPANLATMLTNLKSRLRNRGIAADNIMFDIMSATTDVDSKYIRTGILDTDLDYSVDMYKEEFERGFNWSHSELNPDNALDSELIGDMQAFFKAFAYAGIIGSQLNKKFDSYLPLIPESIYTLPMTSVIENFSRELDASESTVVEREYTPEKVTKSNLPDNGFFVFGSNDRGVHGLGAAKDAVKNFGAVKGQATGKQGQAFAVRTKMYQNGKLTKYNDLTEDNKKVMDRMTVEDLNALRMEAIDNPDNKYYVTVIGTKLAGRSVEQMKDFFSRMNSKVGIPDNIILPEEFEVRTESVSVPSEFNFFKKFITRFTENHPEFRNLEAPKTMTYYKDYLLSRNNVVNMFDNDIQTITLKDKEIEVNTTFFPETLKKGYSKFYSLSSTGAAILRAGKKVILPGYENIQLAMEQETKEIFELNTGLSINTNSKTQKEKLIEVKEKFDNNDINKIIKEKFNSSIVELNSSFGASILTESVVDNSFALRDSFNSLREINNNLSKNC
jgi:hypothetical protein